MKVQVTQKGFYGGQLWQEGEVFEIENRQELGSWMKEVRKKPGPKPKIAMAKDIIDNDE